MSETNDTLYVLLAILALMACSFITRCSYLLLGDHLPLPDGVRRALRYAPASALFAIIVPELLPWQEGVGPVFDLRLVAAIVGGVVVVTTRSSIFTIIAGMLTLWGLRWLF